MSHLPDPTLVCRNILLGDPTVINLVGNRVYASSTLPVGHTYPCVRLTHIGSGEHAPVPFRHSATATVQVDMWAPDLPALHELRESVLDALHGTPPVGSGAIRIAVTSEVVEADETLQPPLYRCRADLAVKVVTQIPASHRSETTNG